MTPDDKHRERERPEAEDRTSPSSSVRLLTVNILSTKECVKAARVELHLHDAIDTMWQRRKLADKMDCLKGGG